MTQKCQWVESRLEDYFAGNLDPETRGEFEAHSGECARCREELDGFARVDRLVSAHFQRRLARAERPMRYAIQPLRLAGAFGALAVAAAVVWLGVTAVSPAAGPAGPAASEMAAVPPGPAPEEVDKAEDTSEAELAKPDPAAEPVEPALPDRAPATLGPESPEERFYVQDAAGYLHTLEEFSGSVLVLGVFDGDPDRQAAFDEAYRNYSSETGVRFLGVGADGVDLEAARFPTMVNRNSALLETRAGEFAVIAPDGLVHARGNLEREDLLAAIDSSLEELR